MRDSWKIQIFQGSDTEEFLFTRESFLAIIDQGLGITPANLNTEFIKCLNQDALAE